MKALNKRLKDPVSLSDSITVLSGIGPARAAVFADRAIFSVEDLLNYVPRAYVDRSAINKVADLAPNSFGVVIVSVISIKSDEKKRLVVTCADDSGDIDFVFFGGIRFIADRFEPGMRVHAWGRVAEFREKWQIVHPEYRILKQGEEPVKGIFPIYPGSYDLKAVFADSKLIASVVKDALNRLAVSLPEKLPKSVIKKRDFSPIRTVYEQLHFPSKPDTANIEDCLNRLRYEEAFLFLKKVQNIKERNLTGGIPFPASKFLKDSVLRNSLLIPTAGQLSAILSIEEDICSNRKMNRLLQGDVGSGKTFVCAIIAAHVLEAHYQVLIMVPTEILARQHMEVFKRFYAGTETPIQIVVSGGEKVKVDKAGIFIGTHALLSETASFAKVGLVIIDEQHKFGVKQRIELREKGNRADLLLVSATPIPRTVAISMYGDMALSRIDGLPQGRKEVKTHIVSSRKRADMYRFIYDKIKSGGRTFFILPAIGTDTLVGMKSVSSIQEEFNSIDFFKDNFVALHGAMTSLEKINAIKSFVVGEKPIIVATTVVEVGIDIKEADIMVIENPERFGFAQLHQLRGRVGRGERDSFCFLLVKDGERPEVIERLHKFALTNDGFEIAEIDLQNRGAGELSGYNQSGFGEFKFIDIVRDEKLLEIVKEDISFQVL